MVDYKIGDKIRIIHNTSDIPSLYVGGEYTIADISAWGEKRPYISFKNSDGENIYLYTADIQHAKPKKDLSNFKNYIKQKVTLANVAKV